MAAALTTTAVGSAHSWELRRDGSAERYAFPAIFYFGLDAEK
jgi:hypothetical protein